MDERKLESGCIFDLQGFSLHDGPGCRSLIFLKGCPLRCVWCCNPEGINPYPEPLYNQSKCIEDKECISHCQYNAIQWKNQGLRIDRSRCITCDSYDCAHACQSEALQIAGYPTTVDQVMKKIQRDRSYWGAGGGITLTGGEPFFQAAFANALLKACYDSYIHTAAETCGCVPWSNYEDSLPYLDWIFFDLKHIHPRNHIRITSKGNKPILENASRLADSFNGRLIFRLPVIPGFNDDNDCVTEIAEFISQTGRREVNILPLHHMGREKYKLLQSEYVLDYTLIPDESSLKRIAQIFASRSVKCYTGSITPF